MEIKTGRGRKEQEGGEEDGWRREEEEKKWGMTVGKTEERI